MKMKTVQLLHNASEEQLAGLLTKGFDVVLTHEIRKLIGGL